jgi:5-bromo-4-chloroindolyl phosphate hydrolysis protein
MRQVYNLHITKHLCMHDSYLLLCWMTVALMSDLTRAFLIHRNSALASFQVRTAQNDSISHIPMKGNTKQHQQSCEKQMTESKNLLNNVNRASTAMKIWQLNVFYRRALRERVTLNTLLRTSGRVKQLNYQDPNENTCPINIAYKAATKRALCMLQLFGPMLSHFHNI